jgi:hypothetical protein
LSILQGNSCSITQKSGEIWTVQMDLQQIYPKSDRLLALSRIMQYLSFRYTHGSPGVTAALAITTGTVQVRS